MSDATLELDLSELPKPTSIKLSTTCGQAYMTICLGSVRSARTWAQALGLTIVDEDPDCRYITVRQESGSGVAAGVHVLLMGTESVPTAQWPKRKAIKAEAEGRAQEAAEKAEHAECLDERMRSVA